MDYSFLQQYWWFLISLLGGLLVFLLFVQGGQTLLFQIGKTTLEQTMLINALGRKWEFTFTTLVTFGGALFAAFPLLYSTSFGGAYWLWMLILFCFILQAVSYEFRMKKGNLLGKRTYEIFLLINGFGGLILLGVAVGLFFSGADFMVNKSNLMNPFQPAISSWMNPWHGLEAILNIQNLSLGLSVFFLARTLAALYFINSINNETIQYRSRKQVIYNAIPFLLLFLFFLGWTFSSTGYSFDPVTGMISEEKGKYLNNLIEMPFVTAFFVLGTALLFVGIIGAYLKPVYKKGIWFAGSGTILAILCLFLTAGWNHTAFFPSTADVQSSLTITNASSSRFTLMVMSIVSLIIPFVAAYIFLAWKAINKTPIDAEEMTSEDHKY
jgi:cytochrome d ubiquinol oxidase subunit II